MTIRVRGGHKPARRGAGGSRILITVNVLGSAGPIRFLTSEGERVGDVISTALRAYAREGRLPVLGSDRSEFLLFCSHSDDMDALNPEEPIGAKGGRSFVLCKKQLQQFSLLDPISPQQPYSRSSPEKKAGNGGSWKAWLNKSFNFKISSH